MAQGYSLPKNLYSILSGVANAVNPLYHPVRDTMVIIGAAAIAGGIYLATTFSGGGSPSIPNPNLNISNNNAGQQSGEQVKGPSSIDSLVTATPNPDPYGAKALIKEINSAGASATPEQIGAWARIALEMYMVDRAEDVMLATIYAAFSLSDSKGVYEIGKACAEWRGLTMENPITANDLKKRTEDEFKRFQASFDKREDVESKLLNMKRIGCLVGPPKRN